MSARSALQRHRGLWNATPPLSDRSVSFGRSGTDAQERGSVFVFAQGKKEERKKNEEAIFG
jgi:hypothetical protein